MHGWARGWMHICMRAWIAHMVPPPTRTCRFPTWAYLLTYVRTYVYSLTHSPTHPLTHSPTHSPTHSLTHRRHLLCYHARLRRRGAYTTSYFLLSSAIMPVYVGEVRILLPYSYFLLPTSYSPLLSCPSTSERCGTHECTGVNAHTNPHTCLHA